VGVKKKEIKKKKLKKKGKKLGGGGGEAATCEASHPLNVCCTSNCTASVVVNQKECSSQKLHKGVLRRSCLNFNLDVDNCDTND